MQSEDRIRLAHMREAAREAIMFVVGRKRGDLDDDRMLLLALVKCIEILGEAGSKVSAQAQLEAPEIPWRSIVAMRNRLIHGYFDIDADIVWQTVSSELPPLIAAMTALLERD
jgi:uncharacterized protein with HEPN domain